ncbi:hypothetical protein [Neobacillus cucumis]|uniref:Uncharacterized protein n=1 Tax=Neobacillus cucumis TaxID=1740721 RepID=A0A2N5HC64_9BACI|nr:hypothetical protein [Neobacillus cucumis]PLS03102.1 hypothetical protein CVD27_15675 [Neobacillus cucumis]
MTDSIYSHLKKRGVVVPEHYIQPLKAQWDVYQLLNNSPNLNNFTNHNLSSKNSQEELGHE